MRMTGNILEQGNLPGLWEMVARLLGQGWKLQLKAEHTQELSACGIRARGGPAAESSGSVCRSFSVCCRALWTSGDKAQRGWRCTNYFEIIRASSQPPSFLLLGLPSFPPGAGQELKELKLLNTEKC